MAWSTRFLAELEKPTFRPVYRLSSRLVDTEPFGYYVIASAPGYGEDEVLIGDGGPRIQGSKVTPVSWASTIGQFSIPLSGDISELLRRFSRGTVVVLEMGFVGWSFSDFEIIAVGQVWNIAGADPAWTLTCRDILSMLGSRLSLTSGLLALFTGLGTTTTVDSSDYSGGGTLTVVSTTGFSGQTGGPYAVKVTPSSGDDPYYIVATGTTATTFTGCTDGNFGLTVTTAAVGSTVTEVGYLEGHPLDIVRRLLLSVAGVGVNGEWDDYPQRWGWGLPQDFVDDEDIANWKRLVVAVASGSYTWQIVIEESIEDPYSWLAQLLADAGLFLTTRMGMLTVRSGQLHTSASAGPYDADEEILDEHIETCSFEGLWSPEAGEEYAEVTATTATGSLTATDALQTLPGAITKSYDVSDRVYSNEGQVRSEMTGRLTESATRTPEAIILVLRGLGWGRLAAGTIPRLTTPRLRGRMTSTVNGYDRRHIFVTQVSPDHQSNRTTVRALAYPTSEEVFE